MTLLEQVSQQLKDAMRAKDARRFAALRKIGLLAPRFGNRL